MKLAGKSGTVAYRRQRDDDSAVWHAGVMVTFEVTAFVE